MLPDGSIIVAGAAERTSVQFEDIILKYGRGPSVTNLAPEWVLPTRARLRATSMGNFAPAEIYWDYGPTTSYGNSTPRQSVFEGWTPGPPMYFATIEGLAKNTVYHARAVAVSAHGVTVSADYSFTTGWDANRDRLPDEWELEKWGNTSFRSAGGDDDHDGSSNLLEYALDRDPQKVDAGVVPSPMIDADGHLAMTIIKRPHAELTVEASTDLVTWLPATVVTATLVSPLGATWGASWQAPGPATTSSAGSRLREIIRDTLESMPGFLAVQPALTRVMM